MIHGDTDRSSDVADLPGLSGREFDCLRNHLKNAKFEFVFKEMNSFEVSLAKFLAENCMAVAANCRWKSELFKPYQLDGAEMEN